MGIRMTQFMGLSKAAEDFIEQHCRREPIKTCPTCKHTTGGDYCLIDEPRSVEGMFNEPIFLNTYLLKGGRIAREVHQTTVWSSGPCIFTCLEIDGEKCYKWPQSEVDNI